MRSVLQPPRALLLVCAYSVHFCLLLSEASHCSLPLQPRHTAASPDRGNFTMFLLLSLNQTTRRTDCSWLFSPSFGWGQRWALFSLTLLTLLNCLVFSALAPPLCGSLQRRTRGLHVKHSDTTVWSSVRGRCSRFTVRYFTTTRSAVWALCRFHTLLPFTCSVDCFSSLVHADVTTSLNSAMASLGPSWKPPCGAVFYWMRKLSFAENLFCPGLHVLPARLNLHEGSLDLALLHPTATQLRPINIFWTFLWLQLHLLNPLHLSFHCVPFKMFWSLRSRRSPCQSTDSCTIRIIDTCRCDSTVSPRARAFPCTAALELPQPLAPSGCSWQCAAPVC